MKTSKLTRYVLSREEFFDRILRVPPPISPKISLLHYSVLDDQITIEAEETL